MHVNQGSEPFLGQVPTFSYQGFANCSRAQQIYIFKEKYKGTIVIYCIPLVKVDTRFLLYILKFGVIY